MSTISTSIVKEAVYKLCFDANTCLNEQVYNKFFDAYISTTNQETKKLLEIILQNAKVAYEKKLPLCQDTGQVIVFVELGQNVVLSGQNLNETINEAISKCYTDNYFRMSVVNNAVFNRNNTKTNTPAVIYTNITDGDEINIKILIKGAGSENKSVLNMMLPTTSEEEFIQKVGNNILAAGENSCPPMFVGIGVGYTSDMAMLLSKKALLSETFSEDELFLSQKIKDYVNSKSPEKYGNSFVLDVKMHTSSTHIACMPVGITLNCHSDRYSSCTINKDNVVYHHKKPDFKSFNTSEAKLSEVKTSDIETIKSLKTGDKVLLSGEVFVARDMAHKLLCELIEKGKKLPIDLKNKIILYAGPCPAKPNEIIGSIGPTTASRMDNYTAPLIAAGMIASIGKGSRNAEISELMKSNNVKYFVLQGGIAALLSQKVLKSEIIAFEHLGAEAIYKLQVEKLPLVVA